MSAPGHAAVRAADWLDALTGLETDDERRRFFGERRELVDAGLAFDLCKDVGRVLGVDVGQADRLAAAARFLAEELDDDGVRALAARATANVLHSTGEHPKAQAFYQLALDRFRALGDEVQAAVTRSSALLNLAYLGEYDLVYEWEEKARRVFERLDERARLAVLEHNFANILYRQDRWEEALQAYQLAHEEFLEVGRSFDVATCLRNIAVCHISLNNFDRALAVYEESRAFCAAQGLPLLLLEVDYNIAYLYYLRGEYARAIQLFQAARKRCEAGGDDYHKALCDLDQAEIYLELNLTEKAEELAHDAFQAFEALEVPYETAKALTNAALALTRQGKGAQALKLLMRAREIFVHEQNQLWIVLVDFYRAVVLYRERLLPEALELASATREAFARSEIESRAAMCELLLAEVLVDLNEPDEAHDACRAALRRLERLEQPALEYKAYRVLGQVEEAAGRPAEALAAYRESDRWLERLRSQLQSEDLKIAFLEDKQKVYESLVWLTMADDALPSRGETAFGYFEKAKSRSLTDLLSFRASALPSRAHEAAQVRALREQLNGLYRQIDRRQMRGGEGSLEEVAKLHGRIRREEDELLRLLHEIRTTDEEFSSLQSGAMVDLHTLRRALPEDSLIVEYFIARGRIFVCLLDRERLEIELLASAAETRRLHRLLLFQLSRLSSGTAQAGDLHALVDQAVRNHLRELYDALLAPIRGRLDKRHLVVVPHGFLHYVPFHALHDGDGFLVDRFSLSYAPSASVYHLCATKVTDCENRSLVLGVADERAPQIRDEARAVAESLPAPTLFLGEDASEEALRQHGSRSRFVHLATHGLFRRENPMFSAIQLGTSRLSLFDLYDLRLGAELVVLSGCGTGLQAVRGADELLGLTRGILYAGAQSVLVTLWDVHDASTALFMQTFYRRLAAGTGRAEALRQAMVDLRESYPDPYHWAPFVLVGRPG